MQISQSNWVSGGQEADQPQLERHSHDLGEMSVFVGYPCKTKWRLATDAYGWEPGRYGVSGRFLLHFSMHSQCSCQWEWWDNDRGIDGCHARRYELVGRCELDQLVEQDEPTCWVKDGGHGESCTLCDVEWPEWSISARQVQKRSGPYADRARRQSPLEFHLGDQRQLVDFDFASLRNGASGEELRRRMTEEVK